MVKIELMQITSVFTKCRGEKEFLLVDNLNHKLWRTILNFARVETRYSEWRRGYILTIPYLEVASNVEEVAMNDWFKLRLIHYITNTITSSLHFTLYLLSNTLTLNNLHCHKCDKSYISFQNIASERNNWLHMLQHCTAWQLRWYDCNVYPMQF